MRTLECGHDYEPRYATPEQVRSFVQAMANKQASLNNPGWQPSHRLIARMENRVSAPYNMNMRDYDDMVRRTLGMKPYGPHEGVPPMQGGAPPQQQPQNTLQARLQRSAQDMQAHNAGVPPTPPRYPASPAYAGRAPGQAAQPPR